MGRPRKTKLHEKIEEVNKSSNDTSLIVQEYANELDKNPEYSLLVDPTNKYNLTDEHRNFIKYYTEFKNIGMAAELCDISVDAAKAYFISYATQEEIKRINNAMYHRRFKQKLLSIEQIGGYLSSLLTDTDVPYADRLKTTEKIRVAQMIIDLNKYQSDAINNPSTIINADVETEVKNMSIDSIKTLLAQMGDNKSSQKEAIISNLDAESSLSPDDIDYLKTLSVSQLLELINGISKK